MTGMLDQEQAHRRAEFCLLVREDLGLADGDHKVLRALDGLRKGGARCGSWRRWEDRRLV